MAGILNFSRYLETLQTLTELGNTFPSSQKTIKYYVGAPGTTEGWTATIQWKTLIIDQYEIDQDQTPNFTNSRVYGYYNGGELSQYSTGTITLPANMYTGPILPASQTNVPITVVNVSWLRGQETFDVNLALIQNWEPGVTIGNPFGGIDFEPIEPTSSTFTLTGPAKELVGVTATFVATSDIPISLGSPNPAYLYRDTGILTSSTIMVDHTATFSVSLPAGTYTLYAQFGGIGNYSAVTSNTLTFLVEAGIPLILDTDSLNPSKVRYFSGDTIDYSIKVIPDPAYTPSGENITTTNRISLVNQFPPNSATEFYNDRFYLGQSTGTISIIGSMIDSALSWTGTVYSITGYSTNTSLYTATILVTNTNTIKTEWDQQIQGRYSEGNYSRPITLASTESRTLAINPFPLTLTISTSRAIVNSSISVTVATTTSQYGNQISLYAKEQSSATTQVLFTTNTSGLSGFTRNIQFSSTGTYSIYAGYPNDFGQSINYANAASQSNTVVHEATAGNDLPLTFEFFRTASNDILRVTANTSTTLTNAVSFYNTLTNFLGSATWTRSATTSSTVVETLPIQEVFAAPPGIIYHSTSTRAVLSSRSAPLNYNTVSSIITYQYYDLSNEIQEINTASVITTQYPSQDISNNQTTIVVKNYRYSQNRPTWQNTALTFGIRPWFNYYGRAYPPNVNPLVNRSYLAVFQRASSGNHNALTYSLQDWIDAPIIQYSGSNSDVRRWEGSDALWNTTPLTATNRLAYYNWNTNIDLQDEGFTNPNIFRAWKYYDGSNYNLSTTTAFLDSLDPISTGSWTVVLQKTWDLNTNSSAKLFFNQHFGVNPYKASNQEIQYADESRVYDDSLNDYSWDLYDISRIDTIGDSRGYNVIGLNAQRMGSVPTVSALNPKRLYFQPKYYYEWRTAEYTQSGNLWYIDLVEYLGTITVSDPIKTREQYQGIDAVSTSSVHLFRFTPEVRQTNRQFKVTTPLVDHINQIPANTYQGSGRVRRIAVSQKGIFKMPPNAPRWADQWCRSDFFKFRGTTLDNPNYGRKVWVSRDTQDQTENRYTDFCNAWYGAFVECWNNLYTLEIQGSGPFTQKVAVQGTELTGNINKRWDYKGWNFAGPTTATTVLSSNYHKMWFANSTTVVSTASFSNTQTAQLSLSTGTVDIYKELIASWPGTLGQPEYGNFNPQTLTIAATGTVLLNFRETNSSTIKTMITPFIPVRLEASLQQNLAGSITYYNSLTSFIFGTATVVNQVANLTVDFNTFTGQVVGNQTPITVKFNENLTGREIIGQTKNISVFNTSGYSSTVFSKSTPWGSLGLGNYYSGLFPSIESAPNPYQIRNALYYTAWRVNGSLNFLFPKVSSLSINPAYTYNVRIQIGLVASYSHFPFNGGTYGGTVRQNLQTVTIPIDINQSADYYQHQFIANNILVYIPTPPWSALQSNYRINSIGTFIEITYLENGQPIDLTYNPNRLYFYHNLTCSNPQGI